MSEKGLESHLNSSTEVFDQKESRTTLDELNQRRACVNSVQHGCAVSGEAQKSPLVWRFYGMGGGGIFSGACSLGTLVRDPLSLIKSPFCKYAL